MKYASIVPLIGGETLAMEAAFEKRPEYFVSYPPFANNDQHIVEHYNNEVPYNVITEDNPRPKFEQVDIVNTVCPCAGLSTLSSTASSTNAANDWMYTTSRYVLEDMRPKVFWGENSPHLAGAMGKPVVKQLREIGDANGYTLSIYRTKSLLHGLPQVRNRTFYFFWKDDRIPLFHRFNRKLETFAELIENVELHEDDPMNIPSTTHGRKPTDDPYYKFILEHIHGGISHKEFAELIDCSWDTLNYIEHKLGTFDKAIPWFEENGYEKQAKKCKYMYDKLKSGGGVMRRGVCIPKNNIGAFVGHLPVMVTHPVEDRFLTIRECLAMMKLPADFQLQGGRKNLNHICQNVPVTTATDMAEQIKLYLAGELEMVDARFGIQSNLNGKFDVERDTATLDAFL
jgi:site-specific DNA-cytosine methylase